MRLAVFAWPLVLAGCVSNGVQPLRPLEISTAPYSPIIAATVTGSLAYEHGCLLFYGDTAKQVLAPIWPEGTIFNGTSLIFHKPGRADEPIVLNQEFVLSGRPLTWPTVPGPRASEFQRQCGGTPFAVADVAPAN
jgi:hypothetical protein